MDIVKEISQFRLGTVNVHFFSDLQGQSNVHHLAQLLKPMSFDVLALEETLHTEKPPGASPERHYHLKLLSDLLDLPHLAFCNTAHEFGNAVLSRLPLKSSLQYHTESEGNHNGRGMLAIQLDNEFFRDNDATIYVTHLDQISEQLRLKQMNQFEKHVHGTGGLQLIVGDFNALTFDDYSDDYFNIHIHNVRERNSWEGPFNLLTNKMKENGYYDCWREMNKDAINDQVVTCVYKTRIDYIWRKGELKNGWKMNECRIFSTENATDHNGVLINFTKSS
jgi:endonuclease/exonuclease/phosphatase family metal-dependent hydrolase